MNDVSLKFRLSPTDSLSKAWDAVTSNLWAFVGFEMLYLIVSAILDMVPFISGVVDLFQFIFTVSLFSAFQSIERTGKATFSDLFNWTPRFARLLGASLVMYVLGIVLFLPLLIYVFVTHGSAFLAKVYNSKMDFHAFTGVPPGDIMLIVLYTFVAILLLAIFSFALMFLAQFRDLPIMDALKTSFRIGKENFGQIIFFALLAIGVLIAGAVALVISLLISIPLVFGMQYYMIGSLMPVESEEPWDFMRGAQSGI